MKTKPQQLRLIRDAWTTLREVLNTQKITPLGDEYLSLHVEEEKAHRSYSKNLTLTVKQNAMLFAVKEIAQALTGARKAPEVKDYIIFRHSIYFAHSLVANYREEIEKAWAGFDVNELASLDFAALNKA